MNIIFMDYRFVKPDNWKYLIDVLKIKDIYCFFNPKEPNINFYLHNFKIRTFYQGDMSDEEFSNQISYNIANTIKRSISTYDKQPSEKNETYTFCVDSKKFSPKFNTIKTDDPNYLILGTITWHKVGQSIFIKKVSEYRDIASDIVLYILNIIRKYLGNDIYRERICSYLIDSVTRKEFILVQDSWKEPKHKFIPFINRLLTDAHPLKFPIDIKDGKKRVTSIYDPTLLAAGIKDYNEFLEDLKQEEEQNWRDMLEEDQARQDEEAEKQMIEDYWKELGENAWNID